MLFAEGYERKANFTAIIQGGKVQPEINLGDKLEDLSSEELLRPARLQTACIAS